MRCASIWKTPRRMPADSSKTDMKSRLSARSTPSLAPCFGRAQRWPEPQAERSDGPCGTSPCATAEERSAMGCAGNLALQHLTHCACPSVVNAVNGASCAMQPMARAPQVARSVSGGTGAPGSPSFAYFSWRSKKSESSCGGEIPASSSRSTVGVHRNTALKQAPGTGICPRQCSHFLLLAQEKVTKEKAAPVPPSLRWRSGQPAVLAAWAHCTTRTTHCVRSARTSAMSQLLKREVPRAAQSTALLGVGTGVGAGSHTGHRCARPCP
ncbi:hypothetical protein DES41_1218 [Pseudorhodoferax soli]|uniref:Uncharacterized protein n=1 Tax=Pseudorhodoferax soli TaxID=545864 RepID=A0A368X7B3_9BURK|nr:hypothetical protein DES41_1218 [Pseudorhodoferax soli]